MINAKGYAAATPTTNLAPWNFQRRDVGPLDVQFDILYCGVCHSDLHQIRNEWFAGIFPMVPGHEIVGRVVKVGKEVTKFKIGDLAAVGCLVDSCRTCDNCKEGLEQYCLNGVRWNVQLSFKRWHANVRRIFQYHCCAPGFCTACIGKIIASRCSTTALCRHHDLFSTPVLESR